MWAPSCWQPSGGVGAGVTPRPFLTGPGYSSHGRPSDIHRAWPPAQDWNEWGFLDCAEWTGSPIVEMHSRRATGRSFRWGLLHPRHRHIHRSQKSTSQGRRRRLRPGSLMVLWLISAERGPLERNARTDRQSLAVTGRSGVMPRDFGWIRVGRRTSCEWGDVEVDIGCRHAPQGRSFSDTMASCKATLAGRTPGGAGPSVPRYDRSRPRQRSWGSCGSGVYESPESTNAAADQDRTGTFSLEG
jgi:hypothetical protein